uniref:Androgen dependent TFPI regulating protein n=1 Tax=Denticeps clupeoides TaxID=299321 RepID=A0AAY4E1D6_9TELE
MKTQSSCRSSRAADMQGVMKIFHITAFIWYAFIMQCLYIKEGESLPPGIFEYGGPWKYLTFLNLVRTFCKTCTQEADCHVSRFSTDFLFSVFAFPMGMLVVLFFWSIFAYDRQLVYPEAMDTFFPPWMNHAMHTLVLPILLGEVLLQPHVYPKTRNGIALLGIAGMAYFTWVMWVYLNVGMWVYPLLGLFSNSGLIGFFLFTLFVSVLLFLLGKGLNLCIWGK